MFTANGRDDVPWVLVVLTAAGIYAAISRRRLRWLVLGHLSLVLLYAVSAYTLWGILPVYFLLMAPATAFERAFGPSPRSTGVRRTRVSTVRSSAMPSRRPSAAAISAAWL